MHKLTKRIVTRLNAFLKKNSKLDQMLEDVIILNESDLEYIEKITSALGKVSERVTATMEDMYVKRELYNTPTEEGEGEPEAQSEDEDDESTEDDVEDVGMALIPFPFRRGEADGE
jgi:hypothetical protein